MSWADAITATAGAVKSNFCRPGWVEISGVVVISLLIGSICFCCGCGGGFSTGFICGRYDAVAVTQQLGAEFASAGRKKFVSIAREYQRAPLPDRRR